MSAPIQTSIWDGEDSIDKWYSATTGRKPDTLAFIGERKEADIGEVLFPENDNLLKYPSNGLSDWFYGSGGTEPDSTQTSAASANKNDDHFQTTRLVDENIKTIVLDIPTSSSAMMQNNLIEIPKPVVPDFHSPVGPYGGKVVRIPANALRMNTLLNKPLPSSPLSPPYFDYLFADAGLAKSKPRLVNSYAKVLEEERKNAATEKQILAERQRNIARQEAELDQGRNQYPSLAGALAVNYNDAQSAQLTQSGFPNEQIENDAATQFQFSQAGVGLTTKDIIDNYLASIGTGMAGNFVLDAADEADDVEKSAATAGFYGGFGVEEAPTRYHTPLLRETSGYSDARESFEDPDQWRSPVEQQPKLYTIEEADEMLRAVTYGAEESKTRLILQPKSPKAALERAQQIQSWVEGKSSANTGHSGVKELVKAHSAQSARNLQQMLKKKRAARRSFVTKSKYGESDSGDPDVQYLYTKKVRITPGGHQDALQHSPRTPTFSPISPISPGTPLCEPTSSVLSISSTVATYLPTSPVYEPKSPASVINTTECRYVPTSPRHPYFSIGSDCSKELEAPSPAALGFPGQFRGTGREEELFNGEKSTYDGKIVSMGDCLHPNYLFTHTNFHACEDLDTTEYDSPVSNKRSFALEQAYEMCDAAAQLVRTKSQEYLRREIHLECTSARLEGCSVGEYRYYQGHLNIEEYNQARICICWEACACSKMCTRFGDIICPCAEYVEMTDH